MFDELASKFGLKVPDAIDRLKHLVEEGRLTGLKFEKWHYNLVCILNIIMLII
jgi:hypothetical protein